MAQVSVSIAGRTYRMACEDGQEPHLEQLAQLVDGRVGEMRAGFGEIGDQRLIVMAAVAIADDLHALHRRVDSLQAEVAGLRAQQADASAQRDQRETTLARTIEGAALRIEALAQAVNVRE